MEPLLVTGGIQRHVEQSSASPEYYITKSSELYWFAALHLIVN
jgi:hypothetical protein